jgi:hypothetical protein
VPVAVHCIVASIFRLPEQAAREIPCRVAVGGVICFDGDEPPQALKQVSRIRLIPV